MKDYLLYPVGYSTQTMKQCCYKELYEAVLVQGTIGSHATRCTLLLVHSGSCYEGMYVIQKVQYTHGTGKTPHYFIQYITLGPSSQTYT